MLIITTILFLFCNSIAQSDTSAILLTFNEPMKGYELTDPLNYTITDPDNNVIPVYLVKVVPSDSSKTVIFCKRIDYKRTHKVVVTNVKDRAGNLVDPLHNKTTFIFEGITSNINTPVAGLKK